MIFLNFMNKGILITLPFLLYMGCQKQQDIHPGSIKTTGHIDYGYTPDTRTNTDTSRIHNTEPIEITYTLTPGPLTKDNRIYVKHISTDKKITSYTIS